MNFKEHTVILGDTCVMNIVVIEFTFIRLKFWVPTKIWASLEVEVRGKCSVDEGVVFHTGLSSESSGEMRFLQPTRVLDVTNNRSNNSWIDDKE